MPDPIGGPLVDDGDRGGPEEPTGGRHAPASIGDDEPGSPPHAACAVRGARDPPGTITVLPVSMNLAPALTMAGSTTNPAAGVSRRER